LFGGRRAEAGKSIFQGIHVDLPETQSSSGARAMEDLPPVFALLENFLSSVKSLGTEIAFWRTQSNLDLLQLASNQIAAMLAQPQTWVPWVAEHPSARERIRAMANSTALLMEEVPFQSKVGLFHRALLPAYQQVYILHGLFQAFESRLRRTETGQAPFGCEDLDASAKQKLASDFARAIKFWEKEEWNAYDFVQPR